MDALFAAITQGLAYAALALGIFLTLKIFNIPDITTDGSYTLGVPSRLLHCRHMCRWCGCFQWLLQEVHWQVLPQESFIHD